MIPSRLAWALFVALDCGVALGGLITVAALASAWLSAALAGIIVAASLGAYLVARRLAPRVLLDRERAYIASLPFDVHGYFESLGRRANLATLPAVRKVAVTVELERGNLLDDELLGRLRRHAATAAHDAERSRLVLRQPVECPIAWVGDPAEPVHEHNRAVRDWLRHVVGSVLPTLHGFEPIRAVRITEDG